MATDLENIDAAINKLTTALALHAADANYTMDGETIDWDSLPDRLEKLKQLRGTFEGPIELATEYR